MEVLRLCPGVVHRPLKVFLSSGLQHEPELERVRLPAALHGLVPDVVFARIIVLVLRAAIYDVRQKGEDTLKFTQVVQIQKIGQRGTKHVWTSLMGVPC